MTTTTKYEIRVNSQWLEVTEWIFRSWTGKRRIDGITYDGPVFYLGTETPAATVK